MSVDQKMSSRKKKDPTRRNVVLLRLIPRYPASISTVQLRDALLQEDPDFDISPRSLQRDLEGMLNGRFNLMCSKDHEDAAIRRKRPYRWSYEPHARAGAPVMSSAEALALCLSENHLRHVLPPDVMALLGPHFSDAHSRINGQISGGHGRWAQRVRSIPNGKSLLPAVVDGTVWNTVAEALLHQRQLQVDYLSRTKGESKRMTLHPKGLVSRGPASYLIASLSGYQDVRHFALHRIAQASLLDIRSDDDGFEMDHYLPGAAFTPRQGSGNIELIADIHPQLAWTLRETPLCEDQHLEALEATDWVRLHAHLPDDQENFWWLYSLGDNIRVLQPSGLREAILDRNQRVISLY